MLWPQRTMEHIDSAAEPRSHIQDFSRDVRDARLDLAAASRASWSQGVLGDAVRLELAKATRGSWPALHQAANTFHPQGTGAARDLCFLSCN